MSTSPVLHDKPGSSRALGQARPYQRKLNTRGGAVFASIREVFARYSRIAQYSAHTFALRFAPRSPIGRTLFATIRNNSRRVASVNICERVIGKIIVKRGTRLPHRRAFRRTNPHPASCRYPGSRPKCGYSYSRPPDPFHFPPLRPLPTPRTPFSRRRCVVGGWVDMFSRYMFQLYVPVDGLLPTLPPV